MLNYIACKLCRVNIKNYTAKKMQQKPKSKFVFFCFLFLIFFSLIFTALLMLLFLLLLYIIKQQMLSFICCIFNILYIHIYQ